MVKIIDGDLLKSGADIICHQVNCQGKMNSGVAKQIRLKYPEVYERYISLCNAHSDKSTMLGTNQIVHTDKGVYVVNMFAQNNYGYDGKQYTSLEALRSCLEDICSDFKFLRAGKGEPGTENFRLALPYGIASVRGGAKWEDVYAIIEEVFKYVDVELWRLDKG